MDMELITKYYKYFLIGAGNAVLLSIFTVIIGVIFGVLLALMRLSKVKVLKIIATSYVEFIRGTPLMVQLFLIFYGLPQLGINFPDINLLGMDFSRFLSGIVALSINSSAYVCEIIRSGIQSIDKGQTEASRSLGLNYAKTMRYIIIPQAFRNILPALGNEFVTVIKESSVISVIGIPELMYNADTVRGITYEPFQPLIIAAVLYFVLTFSISRGLAKIEKKLAN
ncbi:MAG: amino acid ABC transporter permease [Bacillota bacterium]|nr:amino acid ABC transporter permease [Bacillota bacterium]